MKFNTYLEAQYHFGNHLDYAPVVCLVCSARFQSLDQVMKHFKEDHAAKPTDNFLYYLNPDTQVEKWIEDYLKFQTNREVYKLYTPNNAIFCPVCNQLSPPQGESKSNLPTLPLQAVVQHLNTHLNYRPFWCNLCYKNGTRSAFPFIGQEAREHIKSHGYAPSDNFLRIFFIKTCIPRLESFITNYLLVEWYPMAVMQNTGMTQTVTSPFINIVSPPSTLNDKTGLISIYQNGGHKLTTPAIRSTIRPMLLNNQPKTLSSNAKTYSTNMSFTSTRLSNLNRPVFCFHCKMLLVDLKTLKIHHSMSHSDLTLACYPFSPPT